MAQVIIHSTEETQRPHLTTSHLVGVGPTQHLLCQLWSGPTDAAVVSEGLHTVVKRSAT